MNRMKTKKAKTRTKTRTKKQRPVPPEDGQGDGYDDGNDGISALPEDQLQDPTSYFCEAPKGADSAPLNFRISVHDARLMSEAIHSGLFPWGIPSDFGRSAVRLLLSHVAGHMGKRYQQNYSLLRASTRAAQQLKMVADVETFTTAHTETLKKLLKIGAINQAITHYMEMEDVVGQLDEPFRGIALEAILGVRALDQIRAGVARRREANE